MKSRKSRRGKMNESMQARAAARSTKGADDLVNETSTLRSELPSSLVDLFEKSLARAKDAHEKVTSVIGQSAEAFDEAFSSASRGQAEYRDKIMEIARANANLGFDLARSLCEARTMEDFVEVTMAHQRRQLEAAAAQMKELSALTQKVVSETTEPIRSGITERFKLAS
jgi:hypothetical protein